MARRDIQVSLSTATSVQQNLPLYQEVGFFRDSTDLTPEESLRQLFVGCRTITSLAEQIATDFDPQRSPIFGSFDHISLLALRAVLANIQNRFPLTLRAPFEGCHSVAGDHWLASDVLADHHLDAVLLLRFDAASVELPAHTHEHSDRAIIVLEGEGLFYYTERDITTFNPALMTARRVEPGHVVVFRRGLVHTFVSPGPGLLLLSYHNPYISLDDPRQYTLAPEYWVPTITDAGSKLAS